MPTPNRRPARVPMPLTPLSGLYRRRLSAGLFALCLAGIVLGALSMSGRRQTSEELPDVRGSGNAHALQRARLLYQHLMPGQTPQFIVERNNDLAAMAAKAAIPASAATKPTPAHEEWVVECQDSSATDDFTVAYDAATGTLKRLSWAAPPRQNAENARNVLHVLTPESEGDATGLDLFNRGRAVDATRHLLHHLGIPEADGPWRVVSVHRRLPSPRSSTGKEWRVYLSSRRWQVKTCLDAVTAQILQITIDPAPEPRGSREPSSRPRSGEDAEDANAGNSASEP